jgi:mannosylglycoprotein endo-beta-mannosidase
MLSGRDKLSEEDRIELDKPFTEEEIKEVVFRMEKNKAAGPDGFPIELFQNF